MTDWNKIDYTHILNFAVGHLSGRELYNLYKNTKTGGMVRNLLRTHGVDHARKLAARAVMRRNSRQIV